MIEDKLQDTDLKYQKSKADHEVQTNDSIARLKPGALTAVSLGTVLSVSKAASVHHRNPVVQEGPEAALVCCPSCARIGAEAERVISFLVLEHCQPFRGGPDEFDDSGCFVMGVSQRCGGRSHRCQIHTVSRTMDIYSSWLNVFYQRLYPVISTRHI